MRFSSGSASQARASSTGRDACPTISRALLQRTYWRDATDGTYVTINVVDSGPMSNEEGGTEVDSAPRRNARRLMSQLGFSGLIASFN